MLFLGSSDGQVDILSLEKEDYIASLFSLGKEDWVVTTPDGRFDTNNLKSPRGLHWIKPDEPFTLSHLRFS